MPFLAILPALLGAGASIAGGALAGHTSTTTPTFSPEMQALQDNLLNYSKGEINNPSQGTMPLQLQGENAINTQYSQLPNQVTQQLAERGFGKSGKLGTSLYQAGNARLNDMSSFRSQMAQMILGRQQQGADLATQLLGLNRGVTQTGPGNATSDALMSGGNALSSLSTLLMLHKVLGSSDYGTGGGVTFNGATAR